MKKILSFIGLSLLALTMFVACDAAQITETKEVPAVSSSRSVTYPAWDAATVYHGGTNVTHNNRNWQAKWWTQGEEPGTTGEWGVWKDLGPSIIDNEAPSVPGELLATESTVNAVSFTFRDSTDNIAVAKYNVYEGNTIVTTVAHTDETTMTGVVIYDLVYSTSYTYTVTAVDTAGNESAHSAPITLSTLAGIDVVVPTGLTTFVQGPYEIVVSWNTVPGAETYEVEINGTKIQSVPNPVFKHTGLQPLSQHSYRVRALNVKTTSAWTAPVTATTENGPVKPEFNGRALVGYWETWDATIHSAGHLPLNGISDQYNVINVAFPVILSNGQCVFEDGMAPGEDVPTPAEIAQAQANGKKVLLSIGGAAASINLDDNAVVDKFIATVTEVLRTHGFDGIDIDIEAGLVAGSSMTNLSTSQTNLIRIINSVLANFGPDFMYTMAPETAYVTGGTLGWGGPWGAYLPIIEATKDRLNWIQMQYYNGDYYGADGKSYPAGSVEGVVQQTYALIEGFNTYTGERFTGLRPDQVVIGLPAITGAGHGYIPPSGVQSAFSQVITKYPNLRGLMTWSINWDCSNGYEYANSHGPYLAGLGAIQ